MTESFPPDDRTEMHYATLPRETSLDLTLEEAIQTREQLKAVMAQLTDCVNTLQTEIELGRLKRGAL